MRITSSAFSYSLKHILCLLLSYTLFISCCVPFVIRSVAAASRGEKKASALSVKTPGGPGTGVSKSQHQSGRRDGEVLVRFRQNVSEQEKTALVGSKGARRNHQLHGGSGVEKLELTTGQSPESLAVELMAHPAVEFAEPNFLIKRDDITPDDPRFPEQWALQNDGLSGGQTGSDIKARAAWDMTTGSSSTVIAVIDSGIDFTHPDLANNEWTNYAVGSGVDVHGWDYVTNSGVIKDEQGHGTAVAGIIAAEGNNSVGISGVMWHTSMMSLRVLDNTGTGDIAQAVEAIDYAVSHGAQVINISWGTDGPSFALRDAIDQAGKSGVVVVCSAGNDGRDIDSVPYYPASFDLPNLISVASTGSSDQLATWSNWGMTHVRVAAPGVNILTTQMGGGYSSVSGTSTSAPLVTGIVGLVKTLRPALSARNTVAAIVRGARQVSGLSSRTSTGGVVSASGALGAAPGPIVNPSPSPSPGGGNGNGGNGNNGNGNGNGGGHGNGGQTGPVSGPGNGKGGGGRSTPPPTATGAPGPNLPDLDELRRRKPTAPTSSTTTIHANLLCADCGDTVSGNGSYPSNDRYFSNARMRPINRTGRDDSDSSGSGSGVKLGSRNFNWSLPVVNLIGRAGMDLNLSLVYNSLIWTKDSSYIKYNADHGFPGPGFQLGFPFLQQSFFDSQTAQWSYMMVTPPGGRVEFQPTATANIFESVDSTYMQLDTSASGLWVVRGSDGTQYKFEQSVSGVSFPNSEWRCTQIEDRNGNLIDATYDQYGHIRTITDTLARLITFNYDETSHLLTSITQPWNGVSPAHPEWAKFEYGSLALQPSFSGLSVNMPSNSSNVTVLTKVTLDDQSYYTFDYNSYGQVYRLNRWAADAHRLSYSSYVMESGPNLTDCPRVNERHDWAENWSGLNGVPAEALTYYAYYPNASWTMPDGTPQSGTMSQETLSNNSVIKLYSHSSGWDAGLAILEQDFSADNPNVAKKQVATIWTQDNPAQPFATNPRPRETNVYDSNGNHRRSTVDYTTFNLPDGASCSLPMDATEYDANGVTPLRRTHTDYCYDSVYLSHHIIGLPAARYVYDGNNVIQSKTNYDYDWSPSWEHLLNTPSAATQHDESNFGIGTWAGRGNLVLEQRWDALDPNNYNKVAEYKWGYYTTGSVAFTRDPLYHQSNIEYTDSNGGHTYAYPTAFTDPDQRWYQNPQKMYMQYNYDMGVVTQVQELAPQGSTQGPVRTMAYDNAGRLTQVTQQFVSNNVTYPDYSHTRWVYPSSQNVVETYTTNEAGAGEAFSAQFTDGAGRVRAISADHPFSNGGYRGQYIIYDVMGRAVQTSHPTEMNYVWTPVGDDASWVYTRQDYDWKGRPTELIQPDGWKQINTYGGCGCAGGEVITTQDEAGRQRRLSMDILGRLAKVEEYQVIGGVQTVYATTTYDYDTLDKLKTITQGDRVRTFEYDGFGRLWHKTTPEQGQITYTYNLDNTANTVRDARGALISYVYNNSRHLVNDITYTVPNPNPYNVSATPNVHFDYDVVGNRTYMSDGVGNVTYNYDQLSHLTSETRHFTSINNPSSGDGNYKLTYSYDLAGQLMSVQNPFGSTFSYNRDKAGRINGVTGAGSVTANTYIQNINYRAFDAPRRIYYGNANQQLSFSYDNRLRLTQWDIPGVFGYDYYYDDLQEHTDRVTFAHNRYDARLDHSYDYDHVGRLVAAYTGTAASAHTGRGSTWGGDGPYAQTYTYDPWGNITHREGWGGENASYNATFDSHNRMQNNPANNAPIQYDPAGNILDDGGQSFGYDVTGQQTGGAVQQSYDGNRLRVKKVENNVSTYYIRSTALGGTVIADVNGSGNWTRGYVYVGNQILALQDVSTGRALWVHEDPVTKGKRTMDASGSIVNSVESDPWGGQVQNNNSNWIINPTLQPHPYTTYERDWNLSDDAMNRRYNRWWSRFDQPDPYDGSYNLQNPQTLNRYAYVQNDPVNYVDPSGLNLASPGSGGRICFGTQFDRYDYIDGVLVSHVSWFVADFCVGGGGGGELAHGDGTSGHKTPSFKDVMKAFKKCLGKVFKNSGIKLNSFDPASKGKDGHVSVEWKRPGNVFITVNTDTSLDAKGIATRFTSQLPPNTPYAIGFTSGSQPDHNYVASDIDNSGKFEIPSVSGAVAKLIGDRYLEGQMHEVANSIAAMMSSHGDVNYRGDKTGQDMDPDTGYQLDKCMFGELSGKGK
jgi:RHS repeat-associated protein